MRAIGLLIGLALLLAGAGFVGHRWYAERQAVSRYVDGTGGTQFTDASGHFRATFPSTPKANPTMLPVFDGQQPYPATFWSSGTGHNLFGVLVITIHRDQPLNLNAGAAAAATAVHGWIERSTPITFNGRQAVQFVVREPDGDNLEMVTVAAGRRLYVIGASGSASPPAGYRRFKSSFTITG